MSISKDKIKHCVACAIISLVVSTIIANTGAGVLGSCLAGFLAAISAGLTKEWADRTLTGFSKSDLLADAIGGVIGSVGGLVSLLI